MTHPIFQRTLDCVNKFYQYYEHAVVIDCSVPPLSGSFFNTQHDSADSYCNTFLPLLPTGTTAQQVRDIIDTEWYDICESAFVSFCVDDTISPLHKHAKFIQTGRSGKHLCLDKFLGRSVDTLLLGVVNDYIAEEQEEIHSDTLADLVALCGYLAALHDHFQPNRGAVIKSYIRAAIATHLECTLGYKFGICTLTTYHNRVELYIQIDGGSVSKSYFVYDDVEEVIASVIAEYGIPETMIQVIHAPLSID